MSSSLSPSGLSVAQSPFPAVGQHTCTASGIAPAATYDPDAEPKPRAVIDYREARGDQASISTSTSIRSPNPARHYLVHPWVSRSLALVRECESRIRENPIGSLSIYDLASCECALSLVVTGRICDDFDDPTVKSRWTDLISAFKPLLSCGSDVFDMNGLNADIQRNGFARKLYRESLEERVRRGFQEVGDLSYYHIQPGSSDIPTSCDRLLVRVPFTLLNGGESVQTETEHDEKQDH